MDVEVIACGSVWGFRPLTSRASGWFADSVHSEPWQWMGPVLYVDWHMAGYLLHAIHGAGLVTEED